MQDIIASQPIVIPPVQETIYDRWVITSLVVDWPKVAEPMAMNVNFLCAARSPSGELVTGKTARSFFVPDVWSEAAVDQEVAVAMSTLVGVLVKKAAESGVI